MKGQWKPFSQVLEDKRIYIAGRQLNMNEVLHSGNMEFHGDYTTDKPAVESECMLLNQRDNKDGGLNDNT